MKANHRYHIGVRCLARGRAAVITGQLQDGKFIPRYRVSFTDSWKAVDPFGIVFEDEIVIKEGS